MVLEAGADDVPGIADIHVRSWQAAYRGILPDDLLDGLSVSERAQSWRELLGDSENRWLTYVAKRDEDQLLGFCSVATPARDVDNASAAEIAALYIDPDHWRQGVGSALLGAVLAELAELGWHDVILWVLPENAAAIAFYNRFDFQVEEGAEKREERSGRLVIQLRTALDEPIRLVPYDPSWLDRFTQERNALEGAIGGWAVGGIHHVGSTAVPGLYAKPIIDILVGVESLEASRVCFDPLAGLDYLYAPYRADEMHWFCKPHPSRRTHHLHLVPRESPRFRDELAFRDRLRSDSQLVAEYAKLKHRLATEFKNDREAYTDAKEQFIRSALSDP